MSKMRRWKILSDIISKKEYKSLVEIGVLKGNNANNILSDHPNLEYVGVDPYIPFEGLIHYDHDENKVEAEAVFAKYENAELFIGTSEEYNKERKFDIIFIDGDHSYEGVKKDIAVWKNRVNPGGIIAGHDYSNHPSKAGVVKAVNEEFGKENIILKEDTVWLYYA